MLTHLRKIYKGLLLSLLLAAFLSASYADATIIINNNNPVEAVLTVTELYMILTGRQKTFSNGKRITVIMLPRDHKATAALANDLLGIPPVKLYKIISSLAKRHRADIRYVDNELIAVQTIQNNVYGISYIRTSQVRDTITEVLIDEAY